MIGGAASRVTPRAGVGCHKLFLEKLSRAFSIAGRYNDFKANMDKQSGL